LSELTLEMRVLQRAVEILGSERALARELRVPLPELFTWLKGAERPTRPMFLAAVDVLIEHGDSNSLGARAPVPPVSSADYPLNFFRTDDSKKG
jgi:hypothetical protein